MKYQKLAFLAAFAALALSAFPADSLDTAIRKLEPNTNRPTPKAASPTSIFSFGLLDKNNVIRLSAWEGGLKVQGNTFNNFQTSLAFTEPTANRTITVPNATGVVSLAQASTTTALTADNQAVTPGSNTRLQLTSDNATATNRTFTLSATGAITGEIYVIVGPATNGCELADTGIQVLSATWSPTTGDTLTLMFDGTNFNELCRSNN